MPKGYNFSIFMFENKQYFYPNFSITTGFVVNSGHCIFYFKRILTFYWHCYKLNSEAYLQAVLKFQRLVTQIVIKTFKPVCYFFFKFFCSPFWYKTMDTAAKIFDEKFVQKIFSITAICFSSIIRHCVSYFNQFFKHNFFYRQSFKFFVILKAEEYMYVSLFLY